jgi:hypothetical protein
MSMAPVKDHLTREVIKEASRRGCHATCEYSIVSDSYIVRAQNVSTGKRVEKILLRVDTDIFGLDFLVSKTIASLVDELHKPEPPHSVEIELQRYKEIVKQLSFELEMAQETKPDVVARVSAIRKAALEQAAEFVMDWGIPRDGKDFEEMCKQITKLKESKSMAVQRGLDAMTAAFGAKQ